MLNEIDLSRVDLNLLVLFEAVLAERHVGRAAGRLNLTASAVSHGLGRLRRLLNDPVFLRTPRGVTPTERALELAMPIADLLARARGVLAVAAPFDPATSTRRFVIGAPDGVTAVLLPPLRDALGASAPGIDIATRQVLPVSGESSADRAWRDVFTLLDRRELDVAVVPTDAVPSRFALRIVYEEDFVIGLRAKHRLRRRPSLERYCAERHVLVSENGDPSGFVDVLLARQGRSRRIALTVPNFMLALAMVADSDLVCALPRRLVALHGRRFGIAAIEAPLPLPNFRLTAVVPQVALLDAGIAWLLDRIELPPPANAPRRRPAPRQPTAAGQKAAAVNGRSSAR